MGDATEDEELFNTDFELGKQNYDWADRFKPRKPRFYNRVHTVNHNESVETIVPTTTALPSR